MLLLMLYHAGNLEERLDRTLARVLQLVDLLPCALTNLLRVSRATVLVGSHVVMAKTQIIPASPVHSSDNR